MDYSFLPDARLQADDAERAVDELAQVLVKALTALAAHDLITAQKLRGIAVNRTRGIMPDVARRLMRTRLES